VQALQGAAAAAALLLQPLATTTTAPLCWPSCLSRPLWPWEVAQERSRLQRWAGQQLAPREAQEAARALQEEGAPPLLRRGPSSGGTLGSSAPLLPWMRCCSSQSPPLLEEEQEEEWGRQARALALALALEQALPLLHLAQEEEGEEAPPWHCLASAPLP
jgi:hypothetical protein